MEEVRKLGTSDIQETIEILQREHEMDEGSTFHISYESSKGVNRVKVFFWQSSVMKANTMAFGSLLFLDGINSIQSSLRIL